jgi:hypothetical protein
MRKLLLIVGLLVSIFSYSQEETTFVMTTAKNEICKRTATKWITINRTYDDIEIEVRNGIIYLGNNSAATYTPIANTSKQYKEDYEVLSVLCRDKKSNKCIFSMYKDDDGVFLCTVEYEDIKYFYYKYR